MVETGTHAITHLRRNKKIFDSVEVQQHRLLLDRARKQKPDIWSDPNPLVTVRILTYNRPQLLVERAIASVLRQSYQNFEILVVGDCAVPETEDALAKIGDPRIRYFNLSTRGPYPKFPRFFWSCAGMYASHKSYELCRGDWMTWLDDDDEYPIDHIAILLEVARRAQAEMVFGVSEYQNADGSWTNLGQFRWGQICSGAVMFSSRLLFMKPDMHCWILEEPGDWNLWRRMDEVGVRIAACDQVVFRHYAEKTMVGDHAARRQMDIDAPTPQQVIDDVILTGGAHYLTLI